MPRTPGGAPSASRTCQATVPSAPKDHCHAQAAIVAGVIALATPGGHCSSKRPAAGSPAAATTQIDPSSGISANLGPFARLDERRLRTHKVLERCEPIRKTLNPCRVSRALGLRIGPSVDDVLLGDLVASA